jgi:hypothetical protein
VLIERGRDGEREGSLGKSNIEERFPMSFLKISLTSWRKYQ